ncbi:hypothetical protein PUNSTDRAFT_124414 [Punctularia strigosozonata HHB-11173 SS5]|uniref:uncharacterized protein n=1 Tax=Punctularia strigosozonata (strain HHB-11173) TaxID=741275 RepID=UPI0004416733|nr:uncharacterized protein PUNSTDRAFT_124414 [Punctularia strigosozonata HHB-11173 SS5]EIN12677.1 hypothetical protein PUNSTDRAFT_124414 [Punctularia strigosozonata HHB-11173 SS5]
MSRYSPGPTPIPDPVRHPSDLYAFDPRAQARTLTPSTHPSTPSTLPFTPFSDAFPDQSQSQSQPLAHASSSQFRIRRVPVPDADDTNIDSGYYDVGRPTPQSRSARSLPMRPEEVTDVVEDELEPEPVIPTVADRRQAGPSSAHGGLLTRLRKLALGGTKKRDRVAAPFTMPEPGHPIPISPQENARISPSMFATTPAPDYPYLGGQPYDSLVLDAIDADLPRSSQHHHSEDEYEPEYAELEGTTLAHGATTLGHDGTTTLGHDGTTTLVHDATTLLPRRPARYPYRLTPTTSPGLSLPSLPRTDDPAPQNPVEKAESFLRDVWALPWGWASDDPVSADYIPARSSRAKLRWQHATGEDSWYPRRQRQLALTRMLGLGKREISAPVLREDLYYDPLDEKDREPLMSMSFAEGQSRAGDATPRLYGGAPSVDHRSTSAGTPRRSRSTSAPMYDDGPATLTRSRSSVRDRTGSRSAYTATASPASAASALTDRTIPTLSHSRAAPRSHHSRSASYASPHSAVGSAYVPSHLLEPTVRSHSSTYVPSHRLAPTQSPTPSSTSSLTASTTTPRPEKRSPSHARSQSQSHSHSHSNHDRSLYRSVSGFTAGTETRLDTPSSVRAYLRDEVDESAFSSPRTDRTIPTVSAILSAAALSLVTGASYQKVFMVLQKPVHRHRYAGPISLKAAGTSYWGRMHARTSCPYQSKARTNIDSRLSMCSFPLVMDAQVSCAFARPLVIQPLGLKRSREAGWSSPVLGKHVALERSY